MSVKKISKENTFIAAILTESGAPFNEEGVDYVHNMLAKDFPELKNKAIIAMMGDMVYKSEQLAAILEAHPDAHIVMSYEGGEYLSTLHHDDMQALANALRNIAAENPEVTSWKLFNDILKNRGQHYVL